jgi:CubicO group peptidase (beta-lactamase class C family)
MDGKTPAGTCTNTLGVHFDRLAYLDKYYQESVKNGRHAFCAARVLRSGVEIYNAAYGVNAPGGPPLTTDAIYPAASITKPIIATLLFILQEEGEIDLWEQLQRYFPEFTGEYKDEVLLWHVLSHVSGLSGMGDESYDKFVISYIKDELGIELPREGAPDEELLGPFMQVREKLGLPVADMDDTKIWDTFNYISLKAPLVRRPFTQFSYSSYGYELLKQLIEKVTGESIEAYTRRKLFDRLGMDDSYFILPKDKWSRVVKRDSSYQIADWLNSDGMMTNTSGGGGLKSTLHDLTVFGQMILQEGTLGTERILSPASVRLMTTDQNTALSDSYWQGRWFSSGWCLGWNVKKKDDLGLLRSNKAIDHAGSGGARLLIDPTYDLVAAFYTVDQTPESFTSHSRVANIIYSALD